MVWIIISYVHIKIIRIATLKVSYIKRTPNQLVTAEEFVLKCKLYVNYNIRTKQKVTIKQIDAYLQREEMAARRAKEVEEQEMRRAQRQKQRKWVNHSGTCSGLENMFTSILFLFNINIFFIITEPKWELNTL